MLYNYFIYYFILKKKKKRKCFLYPNGKNGSEYEHISIYIKCMDYDEKYTDDVYYKGYTPKNPKIYAQFVIYIRNSNNYNHYIAKCNIYIYKY